MKDELVKSFKLIIDVRFVTMILDENEKPVCFGLCFPSIARAVQKSGGRLTLPAILRILKAVKDPEIIDLALIGVLPAYRGVSIVLIDELQRMLREGRIKYCETNLNLEDNHAILNLWKNFGNVLHKRRRCYVKKI